MAGFTPCSAPSRSGSAKTAGALVALAGVGLLALARGIRRGQRLAWLDLDPPARRDLGPPPRPPRRRRPVRRRARARRRTLWHYRAAFRARFDLPSLRVGLATLVGGVIAITLIGATVLWSVLPLHHDRQPISLAGGLVGDGRAAGRHHRPVQISPRADAFFHPALLAIGIGLVAVALVMAFRPVVDRRRSAPTADAERARSRHRAASGREHARLLRAARRQAVLLRPGRPRRLRHLRRRLPRLARPDLRARGARRALGGRSAASPTAAAGRSPCSAPARSGSASTADRACTSATSATRASSTCARSRSRAAAARACARPSTGSPSTATRSRSTTPPAIDPELRRRL